MGRQRLASETEERERKGFIYDVIKGNIKGLIYLG